MDCGALVTPPVSFERLDGFAESEDFVFDDAGNYVGIDADGNLIRVSKSGQRTVWAPGIGAGATAGMAILPDGSVVLAHVNDGAIKRVFPNGSSQVVLGGLLYPNGLDVGPDGFIYVAENSAGRVRRIDADTGAFSIVAMGLDGANGVALTTDGKLMYVGSFEGSGVYRVELEEPGALGKATVFARPPGSQLKEPELACPDQLVGKDCRVSTVGQRGKCQQLSNVVDCVPEGPCLGGGKEGNACQTDNGNAGKCNAGFCIATPCEGKADGTACEDDWGSSGACEAALCSTEIACLNKPEGTACKVEGKSASCQNGACVAPGPCSGMAGGAACMDELGISGKCSVGGGRPFCDTTETCAADPNSCVVGGGIDGMGVDACGYVYATEFTHGNVWRVSPSGEVVLLVKLPSSWIPNIKWGRGFGGFERDVMYVADRGGSLFGLAVQRRGADEYYDLGKP